MGTESLQHGRPLRIAVATLGRFHALDLARELHRLGHDVIFYSYVPRRRIAKFGFPPERSVSLLAWLVPLIALRFLVRRMPWAHRVDRIMHVIADFAMCIRMRPCDVFIGMSGIYTDAGQYARRRFGAKLVVERGSMHVEEQKRILDAIKMVSPSTRTVPDWAVQRERASYSGADMIVVPSQHAKVSFLDRGWSPKRVACIPYGVDLSMFSPAKNERDPKLLLFVGLWSFQKGADVLVQAMALLSSEGYSLVHVGPSGDAPIPEQSWFSRAGVVDQPELADWYRRAGCLVLPSRQEGLALVQIQALACGCPIVGTEMSGAVDLQQMFCDEVQNIAVAPVGDAASLAEAIRSVSMKGSAAFDVARLAPVFSWEGYGLRYWHMLSGLVSGCGASVENAGPTLHAEQSGSNRCGTE